WVRWRDLYARVAPGCAGAADPDTRVRLAWSILHGLVTLAPAPAPPPPGTRGAFDGRDRAALVDRALGLLAAA
ncbi:MAG: hypothetical protein R3263_03330, partial [Myxococcota bacterium]|nr:hypothetical protein [Myxococcota bacterium]